MPMMLVALVVLTLQAPQGLSPAARPSGGVGAVVTLRMTMDDLDPVTIHIRAGQRGTLKVAEQPTLGLTPRVQGDILDLAVLELTDATQAPALDDETTAGEVERVRLERGVPVRMSAAALTIEWIGLEDARVAPDLPGSDGPCWQCCILCAGTLYCACSVETVCGACCCDDCCARLRSKGPEGETVAMPAAAG